jgi:hypothetical protein
VLGAGVLGAGVLGPRAGVLGAGAGRLCGGGTPISGCCASVRDDWSAAHSETLKISARTPIARPRLDIHVRDFRLVQLLGAKILSAMLLLDSQARSAAHAASPRAATHAAIARVLDGCVTR